jgi:hypothetical protein
MTVRDIALASHLPYRPLSCSRHLPTSSGMRADNPVTLPPGRARLVTSPLVTGSAATAKTMGRAQET